MNKQIRLVLSGLAGALALLASAGGVLAAPEDDDAQVLRAVAQRFWEAQSQGDWSAVYDMLTPADRGELSREQFVAKRQENWPFRYQSFRLGEVVIADQVGWVEVSYEVLLTLVPNRSPETVHGWQIWVNSDGWRPVPEKLRQEYPSRPPKLRSAREESALARRVEEYWQAITAQDFARAFQYMEPTYRERMSLEDFAKNPHYVLILAHRLAWVEVTRDKGRVKVVYTGKVNDPSMSKLDPREMAVIEPWIKVNGEWYRPSNPRAGLGFDEQQQPVE